MARPTGPLTWKRVGASVLAISLIRVVSYWPEAAVWTFTSTPVSWVYSLARACQSASCSGLKFR